MDHASPFAASSFDVLSRLLRLTRIRRVLELRFFGGLSVRETIQTLDISPSTVKRGWRVPQAWLSREIRERSVVRGMKKR